VNELRSYAKRFGGLAFIYQALSKCLVVYIQESDFHFCKRQSIVFVWALFSR